MRQERPWALLQRYTWTNHTATYQTVPVASSSLLNYDMPPLIVGEGPLLALAELGLSVVRVNPSPPTAIPSPSESMHSRAVVRTCCWLRRTQQGREQCRARRRDTKTENPGSQLVRGGYHPGDSRSQPRGTKESRTTPFCCLLDLLIVMPRLTFLAAVAVVAGLFSSAAAFVVGTGAAGYGLRSSCVAGTTSAKHVQRRGGVQQLRAAAGDGEEGGGFVNPYTAFRKWQMDLVSEWASKCS